VPPTSPHRRRAGQRAAAIGLAGLVGLSAAVAIPILANDDSSDAQVVSEAPTTTSTTLSPAEVAFAQFTSATPEEQNYIVWQTLTQEERDFVVFSTADDEQRNFIVFVSSPDDQRAAFVDALTPHPEPQPERAPSAPSESRATVSSGGSVWDSLARCEAGGNWSTHTANGFSGGLQFSSSTWTGFGGGEYAPAAWQASREQQIDIAERVLASSGWGAWPGCSRKLGLR
jgi:resuscitation-promoting factor RpfB